MKTLGLPEARSGRSANPTHKEHEEKHTVIKGLSPAMKRKPLTAVAGGDARMQREEEEGGLGAWNSTPGAHGLQTRK